MSEKSDTWQQEQQLQQMADQIVAGKNAADPEQQRRDEAIFRSIEKRKKKKRRKIIRTIVIIMVIIAVGMFVGVNYLQRRVAISTHYANDNVTSYKATVGSISTTVSGSGTLENVDEKTLDIPEAVSIEKIKVSAGDTVKKGAVLAELDLSSVMSEMGNLQKKLDDLDYEITVASEDKIEEYITAGVDGRVKKIFARQGDDVMQCVYENGALALLSMDGYMQVYVRTDALNSGDTVTILREKNGERISGRVDEVEDGVALILASDKELDYEEKVTIYMLSGVEAGKGTAGIHSAVGITGISGKVSQVNVTENMNVDRALTVFVLKDTAFSANYMSLIKQRNEKEEDLRTLIKIFKDGALLAPYDCSISSVEYDDENKTVSTTSTKTVAGGMVNVVTVAPDEKVRFNISVDESNILSLEPGQNTDVTISSIGDDVFHGTVTAVDKTAVSSGGVTRYSATITMEKDPRMLPGMTAKATVRIQGVDNAVIIPVDALHQTSSSAYVYTTYDVEMQEYGGMMQVETGISNSDNVEIISGLTEGDTVWYVPANKNPWANMMSWGNAGGNNRGNSTSGNRGGTYSGGNRPSGGGMQGRG